MSMHIIIELMGLLINIYSLKPREVFESLSTDGNALANWRPVNSPQFIQISTSKTKYL